MVRRGMRRLLRRWIKDHESLIIYLTTARWITLIIAGKPHLLLALAALPVYWQLSIVALVCGEALQFINRPYHNWGIAWMIRRTWPSEYKDYMGEAFPNASEVGRNFLTAPRLGWPRIKGDVIKFPIWPGVGKKLDDINDDMLASIAAHYSTIQSFDEIDAERRSAHKGVLTAVVKDAITDTLEGPDPAKKQKLKIEVH